MAMIDDIRGALRFDKARYERMISTGITYEQAQALLEYHDAAEAWIDYESDLEALQAARKKLGDV